MVNPFKDVNWNPGTEERRTFARSLMIGFPVLALVFAVIGLLSSGHAKPGLIWLAAIGFGLGAVFWLLPQIAKPFYVVWYFVACCMGIIISNLLLGAFFFLVITPTGVIMRILKRDPMERNFDASVKSYWRDAEKLVDPERYFRQF